jgi:antitoxin (DNA-binding transcriptional repressor) of toxin-antitoxin stability system
MGTMTNGEARAALPDLLTRIEGGEEITITRHGSPIAVVVRPDALRSRWASSALDNAAHLHELLQSARGDIARIRRHEHQAGGRANCGGPQRSRHGLRGAVDSASASRWPDWLSPVVNIS